MKGDLISKTEAEKAIEAIAGQVAKDKIRTVAKCVNAVHFLPTVEPVITGDTSDGYHTFNELYHHRAVLFSAIVKAFPERAWKARQHHDGTMYDGMFIVGIDTPVGQASYHYDINPYWDMFACRELERAPEWDGHTPAQAIERIGKLEPVRHGRWIQSKTVPSYHHCSQCRVPQKMEKSCNIYVLMHYCPNCGAKMDAGKEGERG